MEETQDDDDDPSRSRRDDDDDDDDDDELVVVVQKKNRLDRLPPSICGISLGSVGLAGTMRLVGDIYDLPLLERAAIPLYILSAIYILVMLIRMGWNPKASAAELSEPSTASPYGAFAMAVALLFNAVAVLSSQMEENHHRTLGMIVGAIGIYAGSMMQVVVMVRFFRSCWISKSLPEPLWFPPTVSVAIIGWTGVTVGMPRVLVELSFWGGILLTILLLPIATVRTVRHPHRVAPNPTVAMLQAPASFVTVAWFEIGDGGSEWLSTKANDILICVLFATSTVVFLLTLGSTMRRFRYIFGCGRGGVGAGFSHLWASFTFPSVTTTRAALLFANNNGSSNTILAAAAHHKVFAAWAIVLTVSLLPGVLAIILWYTFLAIVQPKRLLLASSTTREEISKDEEA
jgi:hypothetical protein